MGKLVNVLARIDAENGKDPNRLSLKGVPLPKELVYAQQMSEWLSRLAPQASEALQIAVRAQHVRRWEIPRNRFPLDRSGYIQWRVALGRFHAEVASTIALAEGYDDETVARIGSLLRKERLKSDPECQTLEDAACLVFLEHYYWDFAMRQSEEKLIGILQKTWRKMSPAARLEALRLSLPADVKALMEKELV